MHVFEVFGLSLEMLRPLCICTVYIVALSSK